MSPPPSDLDSGAPLTSNERDYLRLQTPAHRQRQSLIVWGLVLGTGALLFVLAFLLSRGISSLLATGALTSALCVLVVAYTWRRSATGARARNASFDIVELRGIYRWFELYTADNALDTESAYTIAGVEVILPPHWTRYVNAGESVCARLARSPNGTFYVLSLDKGPAIDPEMDRGLAHLPDLYPNGRRAALVGSIVAVLLFPIFLIIQAQWSPLWIVGNSPFLALGGWFLVHRWRFLQQMDEYYRTQYGLEAMSWWKRRGERQGALPDEAAVVMKEDARQSTVRPPNEAAPSFVGR